MVRLEELAGWRSTYDFDAPGLGVRKRLERLDYAAWQARRQSNDPSAWDELDFALDECHALLTLPELEGEDAERVQQRLRRIRRVVVYHEGRLTRLNRMYWWVPFSLALLLMLVCLARPLLAL